MEDYRVDIKGDYYEDIMYKISKAALEHNGRAFSLSYRFVTSRKAYKKGGILGWKKESESSPDLPAHQELMAIAEDLSDGFLKVSSQYALFKDGRKTSIYSVAYVDAGYEVTIEVDDFHSLVFLANRYVKDDVKFEEKLLEHHRLLLDKLIARYLPTTGSEKQTSQFAVSKTHAGNNYGTRSSFESEGMRNLENLAQCYGFAKAIATVMEEKWKGKGTLEYSMTESYGDIITTYEITPHLKSW